MKILNKSKYDGYIFTCPHCNLEVELENEDLNKLLYRQYSSWYENNMPRDNMHEVFIRCSCGNLIPIETAQGPAYGRRIGICGRRKEINNGNSKS